MLKVRKNGQQKTGNLFCHSAAKLAMLCVLSLTLKPVSNLICCKTGLMWVVKRATSLFNSFCSNVARQVARFMLLVFPYVNVMLDETIGNDDF